MAKPAKSKSGKLQKTPSSEGAKLQKTPSEGDTTPGNSASSPDTSPSGTSSPSSTGKFFNSTGKSSESAASSTTNTIETIKTNAISTIENIKKANTCFQESAFKKHAIEVINQGVEISKQGAGFTYLHAKEGAGILGEEMVLMKKNYDENKRIQLEKELCEKEKKRSSNGKKSGKGSKENQPPSPTASNSGSVESSSTTSPSKIQNLNSKHILSLSVVVVFGIFLFYILVSLISMMFSSTINISTSQNDNVDSTTSTMKPTSAKASKAKRAKTATSTDTKKTNSKRTTNSGEPSATQSDIKSSINKVKGSDTAAEEKKKEEENNSAAAKRKAKREQREAEERKKKEQQQKLEKEKEEKKMEQQKLKEKEQNNNLEKSSSNYSGKSQLELRKDIENWLMKFAENDVAKAFGREEYDEGETNSDDAEGEYKEGGSEEEKKYKTPGTGYSWPVDGFMGQKSNYVPALHTPGMVFEKDEIKPSKEAVINPMKMDFTGENGVLSKTAYMSNKLLANDSSGQKWSHFLLYLVRKAGGNSFNRKVGSGYSKMISAPYFQNEEEQYYHRRILGKEWEEKMQKMPENLQDYYEDRGWVIYKKFIEKLDGFFTSGTEGKSKKTGKKSKQPTIDVLHLDMDFLGIKFGEKNILFENTTSEEDNSEKYSLYDTSTIDNTYATTPKTGQHNLIILKLNDASSSKNGPTYRVIQSMENIFDLKQWLNSSSWLTEQQVKTYINQGIKPAVFTRSVTAVESDEKKTGKNTTEKLNKAAKKKVLDGLYVMSSGLITSSRSGNKGANVQIIDEEKDLDDTERDPEEVVGRTGKWEERKEGFFGLRQSMGMNIIEGVNAGKFLGVVEGVYKAFEGL